MLQLLNIKSNIGKRILKYNFIDKKYNFINIQKG
jgi:hypothetical protein